MNKPSPMTVPNPHPQEFSADASLVTGFLALSLLPQVLELCASGPSTALAAAPWALSSTL